MAIFSKNGNALQEIASFAFALKGHGFTACGKNSAFWVAHPFSAAIKLFFSIKALVSAGLRRVSAACSAVP
jgi:hypothetical protein